MVSAIHEAHAGAAEKKLTDACGFNELPLLAGATIAEIRYEE